MSKVSVFLVYLFCFFSGIFLRQRLFIVVSEKFQTATFDKSAICDGQVLVQFDGQCRPNLMVRFWPIFREPKKTKIGREPDHQFVNFFWPPKTEICSCSWHKKEIYKMGQNLTVEMPKIGPEPYLTATYIYIYIHAGVLPHYPPLPPKQSCPTIHLAPPLFPTKTSM